MDRIVTIPILRGLLQENGIGPLIRKSAADDVDLMLPPCREGETSEWINACRTLLDSFRETRKCYPVTIGLATGEILEASGSNESGRTPVCDKICAVTGGAQGFGESIVRGLIDAGAYVFIADMNLAGAEKLAEEINSEQKCEKAFAVGVNVTDEDSVTAMCRTFVDTLGGIDLYVSNAGVLKAGSVKSLSLDDFRFVTSVNYTGYFLGVKHIAPLMARQNEGAGVYYSDIVQINSKSGLEGSNKNGAYAGGKFGGIGLTQSFALELITDNIKVNSICPGNFFDGPLWSDPDRGLFVQYLNTGKVPGAKSVDDVKKFYEAKVPMRRGCSGPDVLKAILYCVDQKYETGQAVPVTGGQIMLK